MHAFATAVFVWALVSVSAAWRNAATRPPDPVAALEAEFRSLAPALPSSGTVGFLANDIDDVDRVDDVDDVDDDSADRVMVYYVAQYALAPLLVEKRTDLDFIIVARDALRPGLDDRLVDFEPVAASKGGHRVYKRQVK
jgi:hypothetical protein